MAAWIMNAYAGAIALTLLALLVAVFAPLTMRAYRNKA